nr:hypothetical protein [Algoriphagus terrigena]
MARFDAPFLDLQTRTERVGRGSKHRKNPVTQLLDHFSAIVRQYLLMYPQIFFHQLKCSIFVFTHQPGVADDI